MTKEFLKIFDEQYNEIGIATRDDAHDNGYWHEVFHCWLLSQEGETDYLILQIRSAQKKDYPNLLDITAAGHLLADETIEDGVREVEEELGINVSIKQLSSIGMLRYAIETEKMKDREHAHVFLYRGLFNWDQFSLQEEEVAGLVKVKWTDFCRLWVGEQDTIPIIDRSILDPRQSDELNTNITQAHFVPHPPSFYQDVIRLIQPLLVNKGGS
ncbi:NUDIX hydrolase [Cytobacillus kochii]|uniref:NUDIX hydrolase n=1 Tax=Cytobacillus kochii TaxID=859143 RepID=UPI001CD78CBE|nr:NUDIX domain-containing protein [Cytobacillus kochii]MCA1026071.1 NUDIX domain-containing protein [Cytobacillus kochii]MCM3321326.1 NUDIX domain-containing protein [Cytobacillus kochii]MCM3343840.1 NUDIX domain-containing protein [Cytobacillus kochii]